MSGRDIGEKYNKHIWEDFIMRRKLVSVLLALTITATLVTGCGADSAPAETTANYIAATDDACSTAADVYYEPVESEAIEESASATYSASQSIRGDKYSGNAKNDSFAAAQSVMDEEWTGYNMYNNSEKYEANAENGFKSVASNPLSTFAADVDTASYSNMRRMIEDGYSYKDFPAGSIRAEELINYFTYDYEDAKKGEVFGVDAKISDCPWNKDNKLMVLGVTTQSLKRREIPASNIVFLIDVSGSMHNANKLPLLKEAMDLMVENLDEEDRVSIVTYASGTDVVLEGVSGDKKAKIKRAFNSLQAGGSTNGAGGIELAYEVAEDNFIEGGNNRIIIASDGDFNVGASSKQDLYDLISKKKESGVFLSVFGFGMRNYNDVTMETLADNGNGNYAYIDSLAEAKKVVVDEFESTLYTVAKDTKFQIEFNPALVSEYRQIGYENRALAAQDFTDDTKDGGELGSGRQITVMYEIVLADRNNKDKGLKYQESTVSDKGAARDEWCTLSIAYKDPEADESEYREYPIGVDNYTKHPSEEYRFAAAVAQYAMVLNNSEFVADYDRDEAIESVVEQLREMDLDDEYRVEFLDLVEASYGYNW